jgi:hypothetical protein
VPPDPPLPVRTALAGPPSLRADCWEPMAATATDMRRGMVKTWRHGFSQGVCVLSAAAIALTWACGSQPAAQHTPTPRRPRSPGAGWSPPPSRCARRAPAGRGCSPRPSGRGPPGPRPSPCRRPTTRSLPIVASGERSRVPPAATTSSATGPDTVRVPQATRTLPMTGPEMVTVPPVTITSRCTVPVTLTPGLGGQRRQGPRARLCQAPAARSALACDSRPAARGTFVTWRGLRRRRHCR